MSDEQIRRRKEEIYKPLEHYRIYSNEIVAGDVNHTTSIPSRAWTACRS